MGSKESKRLIKNTVIISIGNMSTKLISFFLLPMYTGILTASEYGTYDYLMAVLSFIIPIVVLQIQTSMFRFIIDAKNDCEKTKIISQSFLIVIIGVIIFIIGSVTFFRFFPSKLSNYIILYVVFSILSSQITSILRGEGKMTLYTVFNFANSFTILILNIVAIALLRLGVRGLFISYIVSQAIWCTIFVFYLKIWKYIKINYIDKKGLKELLNYSIPMIPNSLSWAIVDFSDRILIANMLGAEFNGFYAISNKFPTLINTFYQFFYQSWTESSARIMQESKEKSTIFYNSVYDKLKRLLMALVVLMIAFMPLAFKLLINSEFNKSYLYIPFLAFGMYFSNISGFYGGIFTAHKETKMLGYSTLMSAGLNIVLNFAFINWFGLYAAAGSTLLSCCAICIYRRKQVKKYMELKHDKKFMIYSIIICSIIICLYYSGFWFGYLLNMIIAVTYSIYINKNIINLLLKLTRDKLLKKERIIN